MQLVAAGQEWKVDGKAIWNRQAANSDPAAAYVTLLDHFGDFGLADSAKAGDGSRQVRSLGKGHAWFKYPQVCDNIHHIQDTSSHMPASEGFSHRFSNGMSPYHADHDSHKDHKTWYTWVFLGWTADGDLVQERFHVILAAARFGIPTSVLKAWKLRHSKPDMCLHLPSCPGNKGGCNNPLHLRWGNAAANRQDQVTRRSRRPHKVEYT